MVAMRKWRGGTGVLARGYYKGGFESKMNRREAALILEMPYVNLLGQGGLIVFMPINMP